MASNTYASDYWQGWVDANAGLYSPPGTSLQSILANAVTMREFETRKIAYDEGYWDREGELRTRSRIRPEPKASN